VATILSAQCTDERVNQVTPALFDRYPDPASLARARLPTLEKMIHSTGFFRNKARNLKGAAARLVAEHGGQVPTRMEELVALPGVGRKTANVIRGACFGLPAVVVDTHFGRVVRRLGFTDAGDPVKIERELRALVPESRQTTFSMVANFHGREVCRSHRPLCGTCPVRSLCPYPSR
jgi:endonuclease-3